MTSLWCIKKHLKTMAIALVATVACSSTPPPPMEFAHAPPHACASEESHVEDVDCAARACSDVVATMMMRRGLQLWTESRAPGNAREALTCYRAACDFRRTFDCTRGQILVYHRLGREDDYIRAAEVIDQYETDRGNTPQPSDPVSVAIEGINQHVARVDFALSFQASDVTVMLDGKPVLAGRRLYVRPGAHTVEVRGSCRPDVRRDLYWAAGSTQTEVLSVPDARLVCHPAFWGVAVPVVLGIGAAIGLGIYFGQGTPEPSSRPPAW